MFHCLDSIGLLAVHGDNRIGEISGDATGLFSVGSLMTLLMLVVLQIVLGFDNLLYISIESKRVPPDKQSTVRKLGIGLAIVFRIALLFVVVQMVKTLQSTLFGFDLGLASAEVTGHSLIVIGGGAFILWTAVKEIHHLLASDHVEDHHAGGTSSVGRAVALIVVMNLVFSFDSILSAMALTDRLAIMATAIVISGFLMIFLADRVADFIQKNRMYEVLGLFVLFIVGVMLLGEGGHLADVHLAGYEVQPMAKTTFYFTLAVLLVVDVVQSRYQRKLSARRGTADPSTG